MLGYRGGCIKPRIAGQLSFGASSSGLTLRRAPISRYAGRQKMGPYAPLYRHPMDQVITWLIVVAWIMVELVGARKRFRDVIPSEAYLLAASRAVFALCLVIGGIYLIGLIFLVWLKITSDFWFIWELLFLMSVVAGFWIMPALSISLICWAVLGRGKFRHSPRVLASVARGLGCVAVDALLYCAITASFASSAQS
jgi:hypothetical protein